MIAEIRFKNMFSFRNEAILSFEADRSKDMESYHVVELGGGVRLLKVAVIYGANASGKSNLVKALDFMKQTVIKGLPDGYSNKYCKSNESNRDIPSYFEIELKLGEK